MTIEPFQPLAAYRQQWEIAAIAAAWVVDAIVAAVAELDAC